jgi:hypothetical protein
MPVAIIQTMRRLVQFDFEFQRSGAKINQQSRITRLQFQSDEICDEQSKINNQSYH